MASTVGIGQLLKVEFDTRPLTAKMVKIQERLAKPFAGQAGKLAIAAARIGPGSFAAQFAAETELSMRGAKRWPKTEPFGDRPAPAKTLQRSGKLLAAWTGGAGSIGVVENGGASIRVGADSDALPYAGVFQRIGPTIIRPKKRAKDGRYAMFWYLALTYGVFLTERKMRKGLVIDPRRVSPNRIMLGRIVAGVLEHTVAGAFGLRRSGSKGAVA